MPLSSLEDVLVHELKDLYSAEHQILKALPKMIAHSTNDDLKKAFKHHLGETEEHVRRLEEIGEIMEISLTGETCKGMQGLITEGQKVLDMSGDLTAKDAAIIAAAQRVEHYEMAGYGCAVAFAREMDMDQIVDLLQETLGEEGDANKKLTNIAEGGFLSAGINEKADKTN